MSPITRMTIQEYDRMIAEGGVTGPEETRIELIEGELHHMSPIGSLHEVTVDWLNEWAITTFPPKSVWARIQHSIGIPELDTAPQPDVVIVPRQDFAAGRPLAHDVWLVIEVADSSLAYDRKTKGRLYATAGISDYWIVNLGGQCVEVYRQPENAKYTDRTTLRPGTAIQPLACPQVTLQVADLMLRR